MKTAMTGMLLLLLTIPIGGGHGGWDKDPILQDYRLQLMRWIREVL